MTIVPRARTLKVRPLQSCDLAFPMAGVIGRQNSRWKLGDTIEGFSLSSLYALLETKDVDGLITYNAQTIDDHLRDNGDRWLFSLRAVGLAASLERMILQSQIAFFQTYKHADRIADKYAELYPDPPTASSKLGRIERLVENVESRHQALKSAYLDTGQTGVVSETGSTQTSLTESFGSSTSTEQAESTTSGLVAGETQSASSTSNSSTSRESGSSMASIHSLQMGTDSVGDSGESTYKEKPLIYRAESEDWQIYQSEAPDLLTQTTDGSSTGAVQSQGTSSTTGDARSTSSSTTSSLSNSSSSSSALNNARMSATNVTKLPEFLHPSADNDIQLHRRRLDLQDEQVSHELLALRIPYLDAILRNEQRLLDLEIKQLQLNYIHSFLIPPFNGVITGIYKDLGENVEAGEPVVRVENDEFVFVVGRINFRGRLDVGMNVVISTTNAFESGSEHELRGVVAAVRGHDADDDEWDVIFRCDNRDESDASKRKFPLNYSFDYHDVELTIS